MKKILYILLLSIFTMPSCSKDDDAWIEIDNPGLFVTDYGKSITTSYSSQNVTDFSATTPDGWEVAVYTDEKYIEVIAPDTSVDDDIDVAGVIYITGTTSDGSYTYATINVGISSYVALDNPSNDRQANSMIVSNPNTVYSFNPNRRGEDATEVSNKAVDCKLVWRTTNVPIRFVEMTSDGSISFYTYPDYTDMSLREGNAVIAALDKSDNVLWSWHIWVTAEDVTDVEVGGLTFLDRNIGAMQNSNASEDDILESYGLYYQWGRKDPFIYPYYYNAGSSVDAYVYDEDGAYMTFSYETSTSKYGTLAYTTLYPELYLVGCANSSYDWLYKGNHNDALWGSNGEKSIYDPSPKGYRVPTSAEYEVLSLDADESLTLESYGRNINGELFMGLGLRTYLDYSIQNYKLDSYSRWAGYYWSSDVSGDDAEALYFDIDGLKKITTLHRASATQIRSIKME